MAKPEQCGHCQKPATIHLTQIVNGKTFKVDLCEDCPHKKGVTDPEGFSLADFLLNPPLLANIGKEKVRCEQCGFSPTDFKKSGRFGCPACYDSFQSMLSPMLANMHKDLVHRGKVPDRAIARVGIRRRLEQLELQLNQAVKDERYEEAARMRDEITLLRPGLETE